MMAICYRDQTYCMSDCTNKACHRFVTQQIRDEAIAFGLPMAYADFSKNCEDYTNDQLD